MSTIFLGEIRLFAGTFAPDGWAFCNGQLLAIADNDALFTIIGTTYGGDGQTTFALPDLRGRIPLHQGNGFTLAETGGVEDVTLTTAQVPTHSHPFLATRTTATGTAPAGMVPAASTGATVSPYGTDAPFTAMSPQALAPTGGSQPHTNLQPYLCLNFIIALVGLFPSQT